MGHGARCGVAPDDAGVHRASDGEGLTDTFSPWGGKEGREVWERRGHISQVQAA